MSHIVEDALLQLLEECSKSLQDFLRMCFNKDPNSDQVLNSCVLMGG